jgi:hypothetical protein
VREPVGQASEENGNYRSCPHLNTKDEWNKRMMPAANDLEGFLQERQVPTWRCAMCKNDSITSWAEHVSSKKRGGHFTNMWQVLLPVTRSVAEAREMPLAWQTWRVLRNDGSCDGCIRFNFVDGAIEMCRGDPPDPPQPGQPPTLFVTVITPPPDEPPPRRHPPDQDPRPAPHQDQPPVQQGGVQPRQGLPSKSTTAQRGHTKPSQLALENQKETGSDDGSELETLRKENIDLKEQISELTQIQHRLKNQIRTLELKQNFMGPQNWWTSHSDWSDPHAYDKWDAHSWCVGSWWDRGDWERRGDVSEWNGNLWQDVQDDTGYDSNDYWNSDTEDKNRHATR